MFTACTAAFAIASKAGSNFVEQPHLERLNAYCRRTSRLNSRTLLDSSRDDRRIRIRDVVPSRPASQTYQSREWHDATSRRPGSQYIFWPPLPSSSLARLLDQSVVAKVPHALPALVQEGLHLAEEL